MSSDQIPTPNRGERRAKKSRRRRNAFVMAMVLVIMAILAVLMVSLAGHWALGQKQFQAEVMRYEAARLADAGADRCRARWQQDTNYRGETWVVADDETGGRFSAEIVITVTPSTASSAPDAIQIVAQVRRGTKRQAVVERTLSWSR